MEYFTKNLLEKIANHCKTQKLNELFKIWKTAFKLHYKVIVHKTQLKKKNCKIKKK